MVQSSVIILLAIGVLDATLGTHCPFPGLTTYAQRWHGSKSEDSAATWQNRRSFDSGEQFEFDCPRKSQVPDQKMIIVCQSDGTWSATLPRCGEFIFKFKKIGWNNNLVQIDKRIVTHDLHIEHWDQVDEMFQPRINANCTELAQSRRYNISVSTETVQRVSYVEIRLCECNIYQVCPLNLAITDGLFVKVLTLPWKTWHWTVTAAQKSRTSISRTQMNRLSAARTRFQKCCTRSTFI